MNADISKNLILSDIADAIRGVDGELSLGGEPIAVLVDSVTDDGGLALRLIDRENGKSIPPGAQAMLSVLAQDAIYRMACAIDLDSTPLNVRVGPPASITRIQRRAFFRLRTSLPMRFLSVSLPPGAADDQTMLKQVIAAWSNEIARRGTVARTEDISGGGLAMISEQPVPEGSEIFLEIEIPNLLVRQAGRIVRCTQAWQGTQRSWRHGVTFIGTTEKDRDQIFRFLFTEELRRRRHQ